MAEEAALPVGTFLTGKQVGVNVDPVDYAAGLKMLASLGYDDERTVMVITYALQRWARGEEQQAEHGATNHAFWGIPFTQWRMVLAAAVASGEQRLRDAHTGA